MKKTLTLLVVFCMLSLCAGSSRAALIFFDDFNSYTAGIPWPGNANWAVSDGSVDLIGEDSGGNKKWDLLPGNGLYLDTDGSTGNAGKITSNSIALAPGDYVLDFDYAGNQRSGGWDEMFVQVAEAGGGSSLLDFTLGAGDLFPLSTYSSIFPGTSEFTVASAMSVEISFEGLGGDNVGLLLDNVRLDSVDGKIPAPGAILLGSIGVGIVGWLRRRRVV